MIGGLSSTVELGNFENAQKIISIPISVITALGTVMLPRMSYVLNNKKSEYKPILRASMKLAMVMATTMTFGIWAVADEISLIMFGPEFTKSAGIMRFLAIYLPFTAWANVVRTQFLIPTRRDRVYVESTIFGAVINLIFNIIFIPGYGAYGACIGTVLAEVSVMLWQTIKSRKELEIESMEGLLLSYVFRFNSGQFILLCWDESNPKTKDSQTIARLQYPYTLLPENEGHAKIERCTSEITYHRIGLIDVKWGQGIMDEITTMRRLANPRQRMWFLETTKKWKEEEKQLAKEHPRK